MWRAWSSGATPFPSCPTSIIATRNNELKLTSTDLDMEIVETVPARAKGEGATTVPAHMFHDIVRKLPEGTDIEHCARRRSGTAHHQLRSGALLAADAAGRRLSEP